MPHLVRWNEDLGDAGLAVIAAHVQGATNDEVKAKTRALGMRFPVTKGGSVSGVTLDGIPHCVLFDHTGKLVYEGHPNKVEGKLREAFAGMLAADAGETPAKGVAGVLDLFKKGGSAADLVRKLAALRDDPDGNTSKQSKAISAKLLGGAQARFDEAKANMKDDPIAAYDAAYQTATRWKGTALGRAAGEVVDKLKNERPVWNEMKARPTLEKVRAAEAAMTRAAKGAEPGSDEFKKAFAPQLKQLDTLTKALKKQYPDAPATAEAEEIAGRLGVGK